MQQSPITVVIPVHREAATIRPVLESLEKQEEPERVSEVLIIGQAGDPTFSHVETHASNSLNRFRFVYVETTSLVAKLNRGLLEARTRFVILLHGDSLVMTTDSYARFAEAFASHPDVVVATANVTFPKWAYDPYGFWQKCMLARGVGFDGPTNMGNFNMFDRRLLIDRVGLFDLDFAFGCEDGDLLVRIARAGLRVVSTSNRIVHVHPVARQDSIGSFIHKEQVHAEAHGKFLRKHGWGGYGSIRALVLTFFRPLMVASWFIPYLRWVGAAFALVYAFLYTGLVYREQWRDPRVVLLPFVNLMLLIVSTAFTIKGFLQYRARGASSWAAEVSR